MHIENTFPKKYKGKYVLCWDILSICRPTCVPGVSVLRVIKLFRLLYRYNSLHNYYQSGLSLLPRVKLPNQLSGISSILNLRIGLFWIPERWFWCLWIKALVSQVFSNWVYLGYQSVDSQLTYFHTFTGVEPQTSTPQAADCRPTPVNVSNFESLASLSNSYSVNRYERINALPCLSSVLF